MYYEGQFVQKSMTGQGLLKIKDQFEFIGRLEDDKAVEGTLVTSPHNVKYIGKFIAGSLEDENGRIEIPGGMVYEGNVKESNPHGKGRITFWIFQRVYEGEFVDGQPQGFGTIIFDAGDVMTGEVRDGVVDGEGELARANGDVTLG